MTVFMETVYFSDMLIFVCFCVLGEYSLNVNLCQ